MSYSCWMIRTSLGLRFGRISTFFPQNSPLHIDTHTHTPFNNKNSKCEFQKNFCFSDHSKAFDCVDHNKLWKILKEMGIPDHLTCLLRNLYAGQEARVRTGHGTTDWFPIGKGCILSPCLFNLYAEYIMWNAGLSWCEMKHKLESRMPGKISITSDMQMTPHLW